ncbi:ATP-binding cassette domain-containing protein [Lentisphaerota bacterium ZTH]|nr:ABC-F family ATP-binding cassette domain-containing protein [Lentisphaerota bacterium]WET07186.1 ATP-binding cassette domain-containing protein [Lentisphaerota bacterium ZTH]
MPCFLSISHVSFQYDSAIEPVFNDININFPSGWTGIVGPNGCGKTTLLKIISGALKLETGNVSRSAECYLCEQSVDGPPQGAEFFFSVKDKKAFILQNQFKIQPEMLYRWSTLSMGERKRIQIAIALFEQPDILCVDEPTNHIDSVARAMLIRGLRNFAGIGIIVSHDRQVLDTLCSQCLFIGGNNAILRSGGVSQGLEQARIELEKRLSERLILKRSLNKSRKELQRRREKEQLAQNRNSKRKLNKKDHSGKERIDSARVTSRSRSAFDAAGSQARRVAKDQNKLQAIANIKVPRMGLEIPYGCYSKKNSLLDLPGCSISLGAERLTVVPALNIGSRDRIALTGMNGSGKTSLINKIIPALKLDEIEYLYIPQEFTAEIKEYIYSRLHELSHDEFSKVMSVTASLGSRPERLLDSRCCSPGEWRKLFFGLGVLRPTQLIIMDEPTNHLDLPSIQCLEAALAGCQCALLICSHDSNFLTQTCSLSWNIENNSEQLNKLKISSI